mmetsp:Transcript_19079/g.44448  ORF Transcript_19079/g.44448 Transcript_19079/m.44448 type:complete len:112 (+) Transcript_19079:494-829(+)
MRMMKHPSSGGDTSSSAPKIQRHPESASPLFCFSIHQWFNNRRPANVIVQSSTEEVCWSRMYFHPLHSTDCDLLDIPSIPIDDVPKKRRRDNSVWIGLSLTQEDGETPPTT